MISDADVEQNVLAGMVRNPEAFYDIDDLVCEMDFVANDIHRHIFVITRQTILKKEKFDRYSLGLKLNSACVNINGVVPSDYLDGLMMRQIEGPILRHHANELKKITMRREMAEIGQKLVDRMKKMDSNVSYDEIIQTADALYNGQISVYELSQQPEDLFGGVREKIEELALNPKNETGIIPPYKEYQKMFGGFTKGDLYAWVARAKQGKSTVLNDIMVKSCSATCPGLILDTELETYRVQMRAISAITGINEWYLKTGTWRKIPEMFDKVNAVWPRVKAMQNRVDHLYVAGKNTEQIATIARRWYLKKVGRGNDAMICYDYLKLTGENVNEGFKEYQAIGQKVDKIKQLGVELQVPILTACQMNRQNENRKDATKLSDDGSAIAMSDRLAWFASAIFIFRKKTMDEMVQDGPNFGTHKMIPLYMRNLGQHAEEYLNLVKTTDSEGKPKYMENFLNFKVENFNVTEVGTARQMCEAHKKELEVESDLDTFEVDASNTSL